MKKTIAQQLNIKDFPFEIKDKNDNQLYYEDSDGFWCKKEYDANSNRIYYEDSKQCCSKYKYDSDNNQIYFENSDGFWWKCEFDSSGNQIYYENSKGIIDDHRQASIVELTLDEVAVKFGIDVKNLKIKK